MARVGRPNEPYPRRHGLFLRLSDTELGALERAIAAEFPVAGRRPRLVEWIRTLVVAHASDVLRVDVNRAGVRHQRGGAPDFQRWKVAQAVKRAAARRRRPRKR